MIRYFVPSPAAAAETRDPGDATSIDHVLSVLSLHPRHQAPAEWIVGIDYTSAVQIVPMSERASLPVRAQGELAYHEVARSAPLRLDADELWLLSIELLEQAPDAPGLDDPVYLYGRLHGPLPPAPGMPIRAMDGQLTISRSDLLEGLSTGLSRPFVCESAGRCSGALLPGDRSDALLAGRGVVLAIPVLPADLGLPSAANEVLVAQLLYDVLAAMQSDLRSQGVGAGFATRVLPVPSRRALEQSLVLQGYTIEGDVASRRDTNGGIANAIAGLLGAGDRITLPPQGSVDELARIASEVLTKLEGWPTPQTIALRKLSCAHEGTAAHVAPPHAAPAHQRPRHTTAAPPSEWMKDFVDAHRKPGKPAPRLTRLRPVALSSKAAEWQKDFEQRRASERPATPAEDDEPDWMKDFD